MDEYRYEWCKYLTVCKHKNMLIVFYIRQLFFSTKTCMHCCCFVQKVDTTNSYSHHDGIFIAPVDGTYAFSLSVVADFHHWVQAELSANGQVMTLLSILYYQHTKTSYTLLFLFSLIYYIFIMILCS